MSTTITDAVDQLCHDDIQSYYSRKVYRASAFTDRVPLFDVRPTSLFDFDPNCFRCAVGRGAVRDASQVLLLAHERLDIFLCDDCVSHQPAIYNIVETVFVIEKSLLENTEATTIAGQLKVLHALLALLRSYSSFKAEPNQMLQVIHDTADTASSVCHKVLFT